LANVIGIEVGTLDRKFLGIFFLKIMFIYNKDVLGSL